MIVSLKIQAQDVHFSQFYNSTIFLNPALLSQQTNDYTTQIQRRSQWKSVTTPFNTFIANFQIQEVLPKYSCGIQLLNDVSGDSRFSTTGLSSAISRKWAVNKKLSFSLGFDLGLYQRKIDSEELIFVDPENLAVTQFLFLDVSFGVASFLRVNSKSFFQFGTAVFHINNPNQSLNKTSTLPRKTHTHITMSHELTRKTKILPSIFYSKQGQINETIIGSNISHEPNNFLKRKPEIISGIFYRINDAIILSFGIKIKNLTTIFSYDINTSSLAEASKYRGGFEFVISYSFNKKKTKTKIEKCPKYL